MIYNLFVFGQEEYDIMEWKDFIPSLFESLIGGNRMEREFLSLINSVFTF